jgi:hypothetical protein
MEDVSEECEVLQNDEIEVLEVSCRIIKVAQLYLTLVNLSIASVPLA